MAGMLARMFGRKTTALSDGLEAGRMSRRMSGWAPARVHVNTLITSSGKTTLARARYLVRNNSYAAGAVECFTSNCVGSGIVPGWVMADAEKKAELQKLWRRWTDEADAEGVTDLYGLMRRIARELFIAGECFVRMRPRFLSDGLSAPLQLQVLPSEMLPIEYTQDLQNGARIRQGIEFDAIGRRVAYHFWRVNPGDITEAPKFGEITRVPAEQILHVFDPVEGGQIRGLSRLTPSIVSLWTLDAYDDAELERKKTAALFSVFIKRDDPAPTFIDKVAEDKAKTAGGGGIATVNLQPGAAHQLLTGEDVTVATPADVGPNYEAFQYRSLTRFCASLGLPYAGVTGDMVRANYANQRAALIEMRRRMEALQYGVMVFQFCRPVMLAFLDAAVLAGSIKLQGFSDDPTPYQDVSWMPPKWEWVDPLKDQEAEVVAVNAGFKARSHVIEALGMDAVEVDNRIAADQERAKKLGITFAGTAGAKALVSAPPTEDGPNSADPANPDKTPGGNNAELNGHVPGPQ